MELSWVWDRVGSLVYPRRVAKVHAVGRRVLPGQGWVAVLRAEGRERRLEERQRRRGRVELRGGHAKRAEAQQPGFPGVARAGHPVRVVRRVHGIGKQRRVVLVPLVVGFPQNQGIHEERARHVGQNQSRGCVLEAGFARLGCVRFAALPGTVDSRVVLKAHGGSLNSCSRTQFGHVTVTLQAAKSSQ